MFTTGNRGALRPGAGWWATLAVAALPGTAALAGINVTAFGPGVFNTNAAAMDAALGITGYTVETFSDVTLAPGLQYELSGPSAYGPSGTLPALIQSTVDPGAFNNHWDDLYFLLNVFNNAYPDNGHRALTTTFYFPTGTTSVGLGISNAQSTSLPNQFPIANHVLYVNGVSMGLLESYPGMVAGRNRNIYLRIDGTGFDMITSVAITTLNNRFDESMAFDHVAFIPAPAPAALLGLGGLIASRRRRS